MLISSLYVYSKNRQSDKKTTHEKTNLILNETNSL